MKVFLLLLSLLKLVYGSAGDKDWEFQTCIQQDKCLKQDCGLNIILYLTAWSCLDDCKYTCMQEITRKRLGRGDSVLQYYGKWPFVRVFGIQEPASVLFSLGNMYAHYKGYSSLKKNFREGTWREIYLTFGIISMLLWTASTLFHSRDFPITEKLDYFMAILGLEYSFYISFLKAWNLSLFSARLLKRVLVVYFLWHISYLSLGRFNYSYNMIIGITLGLLTNFHWLLWYSKSGYKTDYAWKQVIFTIGISLAMSLEIWDFPPIFGLVDAHSLWHLSTIPLVYLHYSFLSDDLAFSRKRSLREP